jgi:hypothetical protein
MFCRRVKLAEFTIHVAKSMRSGTNWVMKSSGKTVISAAGTSIGKSITELTDTGKIF